MKDRQETIADSTTQPRSSIARKRISPLAQRDIISVLCRTITEQSTLLQQEAFIGKKNQALLAKTF
jgi:hypothetical protein